MRVVIQRVKQASVKVEGNTISAIKNGMLVLIGIEDADTEEDITWLSAKMVNLRIFDDADGIMNLSIKETNGDMILVSQFTLHGNVKKGNRPSYIKASKPDFAIPMYEKMISQLEADLGKPIQTGMFGTNMEISLLNDGPVTIIIDTKQRD